jgi:mannosyltransferase OCH1-like enzyme
MLKWYTIAYMYLLILLVIWLTSQIVHFAWKNRPPSRMIYDMDVTQYANSTSAQRRIPRVIHQIMAYTKTWGHDVPSQWNASYQSVIAQNIGEFEHHLWTDKEINMFIQKHEPEFYKNTYVTYKYDMQRVDSFRYV